MPPRADPGGPPRWLRRAAYLAALAVLVGLIPVMGRYGLRAALESDGRTKDRAAADPSSPGYQALVSPTPTLLALRVSAEGALVGVTLLASAGEAGGGAILLIPVSTIVGAEGPRPMTLGAAFAAGGQQGVAEGLSGLFRIGFSSVISVQPRHWATLLTQPVTVDNPDEVVEGDRIGFAAGPVTLTGADAERYLRLTNPGEDERAKLYREQLFWQAWLASLGDPAAATTVATGAPATAGDGAGGTAAATGVDPDELSLGPMMAVLARSASDVLMLPVTPKTSPSGGAVTFATDPAQVTALIGDLVPFPTSARPGDRVRVRLLNGVGDAVRTLDAASALVPAGAEITVYGNATSFDLSASSVEYYDAAQQANAEAMRSALGVGSVSFHPLTDATVDLTVTIGADFTAVDRPSPRETVPPPLKATTTAASTS